MHSALEDLVEESGREFMQQYLGLFIGLASKSRTPSSEEMVEKLRSLRDSYGISSENIIIFERKLLENQERLK